MIATLIRTAVLHQKTISITKKLNIKNVFFSEYQKQKNDSFCVSYCLYIIYLLKILGLDFKSTVLNLYYQRFSLN